nr:restriction endonuclease subunit S [Mangrovimonas sp. CR14]
MKESFDFEIPKNWEARNITEFYSTIGSKVNQVKSKDYLESGEYPVVSQGKKLIEGYYNDKSKLLKLAKPVIVFGDHTKIVKYIDFDFIIGADGTKILETFKGINTSYFYLHCCFYDLSDKGYARHYSLLKQQAFCLPPLEEQKAIVDIVNELFKEVEQLEEQTKISIQLKEDFVTSALKGLSQTENVNQEWQFLQTHFTEFFTEKSTIKQLRETILQLAVQGKLTQKWRSRHPELVEGSHHANELLKRIQTEKKQLIAQKKLKKEKPLPPIEDHEKPYDLPEGWVWCRMSEITESMTNGLYKPAKFYTDNGIISLRMYNIQSGDIIFDNAKRVEVDEGELNRYCLLENDLLINRVNSYELIGKTAIIPFFGEPLVYESMNIRTRLILKDKLAVFINLVFQSRFAREYLMSKAKQAIGQASINQTNISTFAIPLPPLEEQKAIVKQVNSLMALCDSLEEHVDNSQTQIEQLMQSCLREVFEDRKEVAYE